MADWESEVFGESPVTDWESDVFKEESSVPQRQDDSPILTRLKALGVGAIRSPLMFGSTVADAVSYPFRKLTGTEGTFTERVTNPALDKWGLTPAKDDEPGADYQRFAEWATPVVPGKPAQLLIQGALSGAGAVLGSKTGVGETIGGVALPLIQKPLQGLAKLATSPEEESRFLAEAFSSGSKKDLLGSPGSDSIPDALEKANTMGLFGDKTRIKRLAKSENPFSHISNRLESEKIAANKGIQESLEKAPKISIDAIDPEKILSTNKSAAGIDNAYRSVAKKEKTGLLRKAFLAVSKDEKEANLFSNRYETLTKAETVKDAKKLIEPHPLSTDYLSESQILDYKSTLSNIKTISAKRARLRAAGRDLKEEEANILSQMKDRATSFFDSVKLSAQDELQTLRQVGDNYLTSANGVRDLRIALDKLAKWESGTKGASASAYRELRTHYQNLINSISPESVKDFKRYETAERLSKNAKTFAAERKQQGAPQKFKFRDALQLRGSLPRLLGGRSAGILSPDVFFRLSPQNTLTREDLLRKGLGQTIPQKVGKAVSSALSPMGIVGAPVAKDAALRGLMSYLREEDEPQIDYYNLYGE